MTSAHHLLHDAEELCPAGTELYERALREGHVPAEAADAAPCLMDFGLLHPAVDDLHRPLGFLIARSGILDQGC